MLKNQFNQERRIGNNIRTFIAYTLCFCVLASMLFSIFVRNGKSLVWSKDGLQQHINALIYYRQWLRSIVSGILSGNLNVRLWDMSIGLGSDVINTLHYYVIGDPLTLLVIFVRSKEKVEAFYDLMIVFRMYLSGIAFILYCRYHKREGFAVLLGALIYAFCFWNIYVIRHPYFINPMIYFPIILIGLDKIYKKERPWLYVIMLAIATMSSFYFAYMICIMIVIYAVIRYVMIFREIELKELMQWIGKVAGYSILAMMIASVILIPLINFTLSTKRAGVHIDIPLLYPISHYASVAVGFMTGRAKFWCEMGYTGLAVASVIFMIFVCKGHRGLKLGFAVLTSFVLFPFIGHMLNGGSYVTNRYVWAYALMSCYIIVEMYDVSFELSRLKKRIMIALTSLYSMFCLLVVVVKKREDIIVAVVFFVCFMILMFAKNGAFKRTRAGNVIMLFLVMGALFTQGWYQYSPQKGNYIGEFCDKGEAYRILTTDAPSHPITGLKDNEVWRYDATQEKKNAAMQNGLYGTSYYFSLADPYISRLQQEMYINQDRDYKYQGLDSRRYLEKLFSVKYCCKDNKRKIVDKKSLKKTAYAGIYEDKSYLPFGFTTDRYISRDVYEELSVTEKQQALMQGAVLEDGPHSADIEQTSLQFDDKEIKYTLEAKKGIKISDNSIEVSEKGAKLTIRADIPANVEKYVIFEGLDYEDRATQLMDGNKSANIRFKCGKTRNLLTYRNHEDNFYCNIHNYLINLGYSEKAKNKITVRFMQTGTYTFDKLLLVAQPLDKLDSYTESLSKETLSGVNINDNEMTGSIDLSKDKLLCLSIPYSKGWTAYVDGKKAELKQADTMFMALELTKGRHDIKLIYFTPYLKIGIVVSIAGILIMLAMIIISRKKHMV